MNYWITIQYRKLKSGEREKFRNIIYNCQMNAGLLCEKYF